MQTLLVVKAGGTNVAIWLQGAINAVGIYSNTLLPKRICRYKIESAFELLTCLYY
jgi:hypothetical protein